MAFLLYLVGSIVFISGLAWIATMFGVAQTWVMTGALLLLGVIHAAFTPIGKWSCPDCHSWIVLGFDVTVSNDIWLVKNSAVKRFPTNRPSISGAATWTVSTLPA